MRTYNFRLASFITPLLLAGLCFLFISGCAYAKDNPLSGMGGKHNNKAPIEVTSDTLEVQQTQNKAIFSGHVVAIQGEMRLTADKMTVYYTSADDKKADKKDASAKKTKKDDKSADNPQGAIKKIEPEGNVFLATPEETASGATGIYDVEKQEIHLNDNVVLTRGKNILKGDKLVYNMNTGKSVVTGGDQPSEAGGKKQRVHTLFMPENDDNKDKKDKSSQ